MRSFGPQPLTLTELGQLFQVDHAGLSPRAVGRRALTGAVTAMLDDPASRRAAAQVRSWYDRVDGPDRAAALIEGQGLDGPGGSG